MENRRFILRAMGRPKNSKCKPVRIYISEEAYQRLKLFSAVSRAGMRESVDTIILSTIKEDGRINPNAIRLDEETTNMLAALAAREGMSIQDLMRWMYRTIRVYFDDRVTLAKALRPPSELEKELDIK